MVSVRLNPECRGQANAWGADVVVDPLTGGSRSHRRKPSCRTETALTRTSSSPTAQEQAIRLAAPRGRINFFGGLAKDRSQITLDANLIHYNELVVTGTTANTTEDCRVALDLITDGRIDTGALISARYSLEDGAAAFAAARSGQALKIILWSNMRFRYRRAGKGREGDPPVSVHRRLHQAIVNYADLPVDGATSWIWARTLRLR